MQLKLNKLHIQRQFDRSAHTYDGVASMQREIVDQLMLKALSKPASSVLDAGCGTGYALSRLKSSFNDAVVHGLDLAPSMLIEAQKRCPKAVLSVGDIELMPYASNSQQLILSSSAVQWCDLSLAVAEFNRCLDDGGQLLLSSFCKGTLSSWRKLWGRDNQQRFLAVEEIASAFSGQCWSDVNVWQKEFVQTFYSFAEAVASIRDLGAGDASKGRAQKLMTRAELTTVKQKVSAVIESQGCIKLSYNVIFVSACKRNVKAA